MALHTDLPIYKKGCDLLSLALDVQVQMPRAFKRSVGEKVHHHCVEMLDLMAMANASKRDRTTYIQELLKHQRSAMTLLRVCFEKRLVSRDLWARSVQLLDSIGQQAGGWLKSSRDKAPAA
jgi:hypothetical protein